MIKKIGLLICGIMLTSCTSEYIPENTDLSIPENWEANDSRYKNENIQLVCLPWWKQFNDPALNTLIDKGLADNNNVQIAMANIEAAQGELTRVQLQWVPDLTGYGGYDSFPDLGFPGVLLVIVPSYTLNIFKQIKEQKKAAYELEAAKATHDAIRLAIIGQITGSYLSYSGQTEQLELLRSLEQDLAKLMTLSESMYQEGIYSHITVKRAKTDLYLIQAREKVVEQNIVLSQNSINYLLNKNPAKLPPPRPFKQFSGEQMVIGALPFNIIENRPDMQQAAEELKAANEDIGIAVSNLLPTVQLSMARGLVGTVPNGYHLGEPIFFDEAILEIPLLRASTFGQIAREKGLNKASYYRYTDTLRKALRDVNNDLSAHDLYSKRLNDASIAKQYFNEVYEAHQHLYTRGIISYFELIEERIKLTTLAIEINQLKLDQLITIVNLYQDLAAGYNYPVPISDEDAECSMPPM